MKSSHLPAWFVALRRNATWLARSKIFTVASVVVCLAARAHAATELEVAWVAPDDCPSKLEVEQRLLRLRTDATAGAELQVSGTIDERAGQFRLQLLA